MYLDDGGDREERRQNANPPVSPAKSGGSLTLAEVMGSDKGRRQAAEPRQKWNDNSDSINIPDVTMPGVDEEENDDRLQNFVVGFAGIVFSLKDQNF